MNDGGIFPVREMRKGVDVVKAVIDLLLLEFLKKTPFFVARSIIFSWSKKETPYFCHPNKKRIGSSVG